MKTKNCIGLTGRMGSGKGEVVKILEKMGFKYISLSDMVREEIASRTSAGREVSRRETQDIGNRLRKEGGAGILGKKVRLKIESMDVEKWVIDGIRNPAEVTELRKLHGFYLLGIEAPIPTLLERVKSRKRGTDIDDDDVLLSHMDREWGNGEPEDGQQVGKCMDMADYIIENDNSLDDLKTDVLKVLAGLNLF
ncbi:MAG TPA: AAA family ATPase [Candidatus Deferrimicrobium sp.]|nr:AAA family ATPase [Candidatus Deferrimicrobium sp.]